MTGKWTTLVAVSIAAFMLLLDVTVVNVALPDIQGELGASFDSLRWVIDAYALTLAATMLISGSLGDRYGRRLVFTFGLGTFSVASLLCGLAWDPLSLNIFRGLQGVGGAAMLATSLALIAAAYSGRDRSVALAVWGAATAAALALGPMIGGALVDGLSWEWIFFVNVPIGVITAALVARGVPETRDEDATGRPDFPGVVTLAASMALLVIALFRGNEEGWGSTSIVLMLGGAALLLAAFVAIESRVRSPLLDLGLFRAPTTAGASLAILFTAVAVFALLTFLVFWLQNMLGHDALGTGLRLLPMTVGMFAAGAASARLVERVPVRILIPAGMSIAGVGLILMHGIDPGSEWTAFLAGGVVIGLGMGLVNPSVVAAALGAAPVAKSGMASGLNSTFRILGVAIGVAALGAVMESEVSSSLAASLGSAPQGLVEVVSTGNVEAAVAGAPAGFENQVASAAPVAFVSGLDTIFTISAVLAFTGALLALALVRGRDIEHAPGPHGEAAALAA